MMNYEATGLVHEWEGLTLVHSTDLKHLVPVELEVALDGDQLSVVRLLRPDFAVGLGFRKH